MKIILAAVLIIFGLACEKRPTEPDPPVQKQTPVGEKQPSAASEPPDSKEILTGEKQPSEKPEPDPRTASDEKPCSGLKFKHETLPITFSVSNRSAVLGNVTMDTDQKATFEAAPGVEREKLKHFLKDFDRLTKADNARFKYSDRQGDTHYKCGGSVKKGDPQYPAAFKRALYSEYYDIDADK